MKLKNYTYFNLVNMRFKFGAENSFDFQNLINF